MNKKDSLGDRMKTYESVSKSYLTRKTPVIIRLDGCHFHTFTKIGTFQLFFAINNNMGGNLYRNSFSFRTDIPHQWTKHHIC